MKWNANRIERVFVLVTFSIYRKNGLRDGSVGFVLPDTANLWNGLGWGGLSLNSLCVQAKSDVVIRLFDV